ncbi:Sperm-associated antigen 17 [Cichlidogyrus casuarinus]|uniref:Sperm-associated antigen 17 n=1 Tax=Cichlidogyrus casuarinus TaxID=1844966 RepID=A0ABD2QCA5_9PLAT
MDHELTQLATRETLQPIDLLDIDNQMIEDLFGTVDASKTSQRSSNADDAVLGDSISEQMSNLADQDFDDHKSAVPSIGAKWLELHEKLKQEKAIELENRKLIKNKVFPGYFQEEGLEFLRSQIEEATAIAKRLAMFNSASTLSRASARSDSSSAKTLKNSSKSECEGQEELIENVSRTISQVLDKAPILIKTEEETPDQFKIDQKFPYYDTSLPTRELKEENIFEVRTTDAKLLRKIPKYLTRKNEKVQKLNSQLNEKQMKLEDSVRRKYLGLSLVGMAKENQLRLREARGLHLNPNFVDFGLMVSGKKYSKTVSLVNWGYETAFFKIVQPPLSSGLQLIFKPGPVPPGLTRELTIQLSAHMDTKKAVANIPIKHTSIIITDTHHLTLTIRGTIARKDNFGKPHQADEDEVQTQPIEL